MNIPAPRIVEIEPKKLVGKHMITSFAKDNTRQLWQSFMPDRNKIINKVNQDLFSLQVYPEGYFTAFDPNIPFEKWALVEVGDDDSVPENMETFLFTGGLYAVFNHIGMDISIFNYIYSIWIPASNYLLDNRPHFEILGEKYKQGSPLSEEEIWIPIRPKPVK